jgi:hypothetical protein
MQDITRIIKKQEHLLFFLKNFKEIFYKIKFYREYTKPKQKIAV